MIDIDDNMTHLLSILTTRDTVNKEDVRREVGLLNISDKDWGLAWHAVTEAARKSFRRDFGVRKKEPGVYELKNADQIVRRAARNRQAGYRKHERAQERLSLAAQMTGDSRISDAADRQALRVALSRKRSVSA